MQVKVDMLRMLYFFYMHDRLQDCPRNRTSSLSILSYLLVTAKLTKTIDFPGIFTSKNVL